jgi:bisphosphoglycerate-independent phosphoglycerate mutase (AlkP superfamily)
MSRPKPVLLLILDGWGDRADPADNAIAQAQLSELAADAGRACRTGRWATPRSAT